MRNESWIVCDTHVNRGTGDISMDTYPHTAASTPTTASTPTAARTGRSSHASVKGHFGQVKWYLIFWGEKWRKKKERRRFQFVRSKYKVKCCWSERHREREEREEREERKSNLNTFPSNLRLLLFFSYSSLTIGFLFRVFGLVDVEVRQSDKTQLVPLSDFWVTRSSSYVWKMVLFLKFSI